ncbi:MAG: HEAT repeat domain-containing protein [Bacteroidota bacterium]|nr:HEAT repeat domain-containing protein [Bacteroidota bacterium]
MEPADSNKKLKHQIESLRSSNRTAILGTIKELRSEGDVSVLPELFNLMLIQEDEVIQSEIVTLLNDLKDKEAAEVLAEAIADPEYEKIRTALVAACWQNGLSYGKQINTFVDVVISGDYSASIEAFTVIEEAVGELEQEERTELARSLKSKLQQVEAQKKPLVVELVKVIERY